MIKEQLSYNKSKKTATKSTASELSQGSQLSEVPDQVQEAGGGILSQWHRAVLQTPIRIGFKAFTVDSSKLI